MENVASAWLGAPKFLEAVSKEKILPVTGKKNVLITAALPYVNNVPHLGNLIGCVLSADVFARYCRQRGHQTLYICGTDEYGTATETKALQEGVSPRELCDKYHAIHRSIYEWFGIEFDHFGRTSSDNHTKVTQDLFMQLHTNGFTSVDAIDQLFCESCKMFLADRFVSGVCNLCGYDDARGDQCDACGKLINAVELKLPKCQMCKNTPIVRKSTHIFLELNKLQQDVEKYIDEQTSKESNRWSPNAVAIVKSWLKGGLERRCITRDLKWGIPVPIKEYSDKVFYVWFDAPIGYFSITKALLGDDYLKWWQAPSNVELYQFVGKDNVVFHGIMFPCTLLGAKNNYTIVNHLCATEYLNYEDTKFSKSRGTGVFGDGARETGIEADLWRFYLIYMRPESQDSAFCWDDFALKINSELLANLGNFINRALAFVVNFFASEIPEMELEKEDIQFLNDVHTETVLWDECCDKVRLRDSIRQVLAITRHGNGYIQATKPWELVKGDAKQKKRAGTIIGVAANVAFHTAALLHPVMPHISKKIREQCSLLKLPAYSPYAQQYLKPGHKIDKVYPLFTKIEAAHVKELRAKFGGNQEAVGATKPADKKEKKEKKAPKENTQNQQQSKKEKPSAEAKTEAKERKRMEAARIYPQLARNQTAIQQLLKGNWDKFEKARKLFVARKLEQFEAERIRLEQEVEALRAQLINVEKAAGITQYAVPKRESTPSTATPAVEATPAAQSTQTPAASKDNNAQKKADKGKEAKKTADGGGAGGADAEVHVGRLDLRVGRIIKCEKHPDADALYVEQIDLGEEKPRTVVSGLVKHVPLEQMQNRLVVALCNLKPAKMRGVESAAMVMCASTPEKVEIMEIPAGTAPGTRVTCPPFPDAPDAQLNPKKKVWETVAPDLMVDASGRAVWKGHPLLVGGQEGVNMTAPTLRSVNVK